MLVGMRHTHYHTCARNINLCPSAFHLPQKRRTLKFGDMSCIRWPICHDRFFELHPHRYFVARKHHEVHKHWAIARLHPISPCVVGLRDTAGFPHSTCIDPTQRKHWVRNLQIPSFVYLYIQSSYLRDARLSQSTHLTSSSTDDPLHLPSTPWTTLTRNGISATFEDYGSVRFNASDTTSLLQQMWDSYSHRRASQAIMATKWELDYQTTNLMMNYVPGPDTTWATYGILTDILDDFWREWDMVSIYFEVASADGRERYGTGYVVTKEQYREVTGH